MPDLPDWSQSVSIDAASVTITVSGAVTIASGTVSIANASIAVINATGTLLSTAQPPTFINNPSAGNGVDLTTNVAVQPQVQALLLQPQAGAPMTHLKVVGHVTNETYIEQFVFSQPFIWCPVIASLDTSVDVTLRASAAGWRVNVFGLTAEISVWQSLYPLPQLEPNQLPAAINVTIPTGTTTWTNLIAANANVEIFLFTLGVLGWQGVATGGSIAVDFGFGPDATHVTILASTYTSVGPGPGDGPLPFNGASLGRGNGLWVRQWAPAQTPSLSGYIDYSLG